MRFYFDGGTSHPQHGHLSALTSESKGNFIRFQIDLAALPHTTVPRFSFLSSGSEWAPYVLLPSLQFCPTLLCSMTKYVHPPRSVGIEDIPEDVSSRHFCP